MLEELEKRTEEGDVTVCVVGLGYVGLPLAENFSEHFDVIGYDIDTEKVEELERENDKDIEFSDNPSVIGEADFVVVCVPTPIDDRKKPDLSILKDASRTVGEELEEGTVVVYENTVYPGATEEVCVPILEEESGMEEGGGFFVGYSPERVNPGDEEHTIDKITKIVSGSNGRVASILCDLYGRITDVYEAESIRVAEAAKGIENIQRDLNIALMNELSVLFDRLDLDTEAVLDAAATKWNFHRYHPGLVGGHCIPVDPYYMVYKAEKEGYDPEVILAGRSINNYMPKHVTELTVRGLNEEEKVIKGSKVLLMGLTYKEDVADTRMSGCKDVVEELEKYGVEVYGYDPMLDEEEIEKMGAENVDELESVENMDAVIMAVKHGEFKDLTLEEIKKLCGENPVLVDVKRMYEREEVTGFNYKAL